MSNVTLIIPTYRNPEYLDLCLKSATENRDDLDNQILVVVDGYIEESQKVLEKYRDIVYLDLGQNHGMQFALNAGVAQASTEYVFIINDDNVMPIKWDTRVLTLLDRQKLRSDSQRHVLTIDQIEPTGPGMFNFPVKDLGQTAATFDYDKWLETEYADRAIDETIFLPDDGHIFPFGMMKIHYMAIGGFDTFYNSPNFCDWDFFLKLELLNFRFPRTRSMRLYHFGSVATKKNAESQQFREREAQAYQQFQWKWGSPPHNGPNNTKLHPQGYRGFNGTY